MPCDSLYHQGKMWLSHLLKLNGRNKFFIEAVVERRILGDNDDHLPVRVRSYMGLFVHLTSPFRLEHACLGRDVAREDEAHRLGVLNRTGRADKDSVAILWTKLVGAVCRDEY